MPAKRRGTTGKGSGAKARQAQEPPTPPREESSDSEEPEEVPQEDVPTAEEGTPEMAPSQAARRKEKKARGAFKLKDQEEEAMVIEWVQENRLLWDQKDQNFKNKNQKDRLWAKKAQELGYEGQFLRTWYMDLRDFNTKLQRVQSRDGARVFTAREQWVMGQFQFLKEMIRHRRHRLHSVQSPAAAKAALESGNLEEGERLAAEERRSLEDVDRDSTSSWRSSSKQQRGSQEEVEDQYLEVLRKELAESQKRLTALQEREPDDERAAYMKYVGKVVCKTTEDAYEDFQRVFMDWQARWKAQRQQQQQRYQPQQYQQHTTQHQWYSGSSESAQWQPPPHQWRQPTPQMQATSVWGSQSMDFKTNAYPSAASGGPSPSGSTSLAPPALQHFHRHMVHSVAGDGQAVRLPNSHKSLETEPTGVQSREEVGPGLHQENSMSHCIKEEPVEEDEQQELPFTIITVKTEEDEDTFSLQGKTEEENKDEDFAFEPGCSSALSSLNGTVSSMHSYWFENGLQSKSKQ